MTRECHCTVDCTCGVHTEQRSVHCGQVASEAAAAARLRDERDEARGWVKLLLAPYAGDGVREEARLAIARWDGKQEATDAGEAG